MTDGLYQYLLMLFGMKNASAPFQKMINGVVVGQKGCDACIDDLVIYSKTWDQHIKQLETCLARLQEANLTVNLAFVISLGHIISSNVNLPPPLTDRQFGKK